MTACRTAKTKSRPKAEGAHARKLVGMTTKRTLAGEVRWIGQATIDRVHVVFGDLADRRGCRQRL
jgi:hypothetical protein